MKRFACFLLLGLCLLPSCVFSQSTNGTISGGAADSSGKFIPDAEINIVNGRDIHNEAASSMGSRQGSCDVTD
jgi:hypothetical protein